MAEIDEKQLQEAIDKLNEQVSDIAERKALPNITDQELNKIKEYTEEIKQSTASIEELATAQTAYSRLVEDSISKLKDKYRDQYQYLSEEEKKLEVQINIRKAALLKRADEINEKNIAIADSLKKQEDAEEKLKEIKEEIAKLTKDISGTKEDEIRQERTLEAIIKERKDLESDIKDLKMQQKFAVDPGSFSLELEEKQKLLDTLQSTFEFEKSEIEIAKQINEEKQKRKQLEEGIKNAQAAASDPGLDKLQDELKFRQKISGGIDNDVKKITGLKDLNEGILDSLIDSVMVDGKLAKTQQEKAAAAEKLGISTEIFKNKLAGSFTQAKLVKNAVSSITGLLSKATAMFKGTFIGAQSLAVQLAETDIAFVKDTGLLRQFGNELEDLKFQATGLDVTFSELDQSFRGLSKGSAAFTTLSTQQRNELTKATVAFERFGITSEEVGKTVDNLGIGFGKTPASIIATTDEIGRFGQALGIGAGVALQQFNQNIDLLARFGEEKGSKVFKELAAQAKAAGVEISTLRQVGSQFDTFEGAMKGAGKLNFILKGPYLNSMKLLRADDAERIKMLQDSLAASGRTFESLGRRGREAMAAAAGFGDDVMKAQRVLSGETVKSQKEIMDAARKQMDMNGKLTDQMNDQLTQAQRDQIAKEAQATASRDLTNALVEFNKIISDINKALAPFVTFIGAVGSVIGSVLIPAVSAAMSMRSLGGFLGVLGELGAGGGATKGVLSGLSKMGDGFKGMAGKAGKAAAAIGGAFMAYDAFQNVDKEKSTGGKLARIAEGAAGAAATGFAIGGPKGAAIGAVLGGIGTAGKLLFANSGGVVGTDKLKPAGGMGNVAATIMGDLPGGRLTSVSEMAMLPGGSSVLKAPDVANLTAAVRTLPDTLNNMVLLTTNLAKVSERVSTGTQPQAIQNTATGQEIRQPIIIKLEMDKKPVAQVAEEVAIRIANAAAQPA